MTVPRPAVVPRRGLALLAMVVIFFFVARASGAGWVVVLFCAQAGVLVTATVWPAVTVARVCMQMVRSPRDGTAGTPATFFIAVHRAGSGVRIQLLVGANASGWLSAVGSAHGDARVAPPSRGIVDTVTARVEGAGPLGLVSWSRRIALPLRAPLEVGPRPATVPLADASGSVAGSDDGRPTGGPGHNIFKGVKAYSAGDPIRLVHWPATARWGELMVKDMEDPTASEVTIVVDLRGRPDRTEQIASMAAGLASEAMRSGLSVCLHTAETSGPRTGRVATRVEAGRRLARAVADAPPPDTPDPAAIWLSAR